MKSNSTLFLSTIFGMSGLCSVFSAFTVGLGFILVAFLGSTMLGALIGIILSWLIGGMVGAALAFRGGAILVFPEQPSFKRFITLMVVAYIVIGMSLLFLFGQDFLTLVLNSAMLAVSLFAVTSALIPTAVAALMLWQARHRHSLVPSAT